ncbi:MAG: hypothetical protein RIR95_217 [Pseudomonadota bacterium]|jgi:hypothetical protein
MTLPEIFISQITDPFRIGLLLALFATMLRTNAATGTAVPLITGALFVAVIIPSTFSTAAAIPLVTAVGVGIVVNAILLAIVYAGWSFYVRSKR